MGKLQFFTPLLNRRGFLGRCVLFSAGAAVFGLSGEAERKPVEPETAGFVLINGWVLPAEHFRKAHA